MSVAPAETSAGNTPALVCFVSYARADLNSDLRVFLDLLEEALLPKVALFRDVVDIDLGQDFKQRLGIGLRTASVMLCLYSPRQFRSDWCAREWAYFEARCKRKGVPTRIVPILWEHCRPPRRIRHLQYDNEALGLDDRAVRSLARLGHGNVQLGAVVVNIAKAVKSHAVTELPSDDETIQPFDTEPAWSRHAHLIAPAIAAVAISAVGVGVVSHCSGRTIPPKLPDAGVEVATTPVSTSTPATDGSTTLPVTTTTESTKPPVDAGSDAKVIKPKPDDGTVKKDSGAAAAQTVEAGTEQGVDCSNGCCLDKPQSGQCLSAGKAKYDTLTPVDQSKVGVQCAGKTVTRCKQP